METPITLRDQQGIVFFECGILENTDIIKTVWIGNHSELEPTKKAAMTMVRLLETSGITKVLDDNRLGHGDWPHLLSWLQQTWLPALLNTQLKSYAHVLSPDIAAKKPAYDIFNQTRNGVDFTTFDSFDMAMDWLRHT